MRLDFGLDFRSVTVNMPYTVRERYIFYASMPVRVRVWVGVRVSPRRGQTLQALLNEILSRGLIERFFKRNK